MSQPKPLRLRKPTCSFAESRSFAQVNIENCVLLRVNLMMNEVG